METTFPSGRCGLWVAQICPVQLALFVSVLGRNNIMEEVFMSFLNLYEYTRE
jgi:hypothetical protein